ncbi:MAG: hypothetical protein ACYC1F_10110 [Gallionellaceae bacterium]
MLSHDSIYQKNNNFPRAESVVSAQLYIYAHRRFSAASAFDLQRIEKTKTERFTEFICLFFIWLNAERFTESLKHKRNDLQESAQVERFTAHQRIEKSERNVLQNLFACFSSS